MSIESKEKQEPLDQSPAKPCVILDPTGLYQERIPSEAILINTETRWLRFFFQDNKLYWVTGERLCNWAQEWFKHRGRENAIITIKQDPVIKLASLLGNSQGRGTWDRATCLKWADLLDRYDMRDPISHLLAEETGVSFWLETASINQLAQWLSLQIPEELIPFERVWVDKICSTEDPLCEYYQTKDKKYLLQRWLGLISPQIQDLETFPLDIPHWISSDFDQYWQQMIWQSQAQIFSRPNLEKQPGIQRIASITYKSLLQESKWITQEKIDSLHQFITPNQLQELAVRIPQPLPLPLSLDSSPQQALQWVTSNYLPYRLWETRQGIPALKSEALAESFCVWLIQNYPNLIADPVRNSFLNYQTSAFAQERCRSNPVLWIVIDGLGWLDHQELLQYLTEKGDLKLEISQPLFSILPTLTNYAKWSLYSQNTPSHLTWKGSTPERAFQSLGVGQYFTDRRITQLKEALKTANNSLFCLDTTELDSIYHDSSDWENIYTIKRPHKLQEIAAQIQALMQLYPHPDKLQIIIASDHGQMMGTLPGLMHLPDHLEVKERMAIGSTEDERFWTLDPDKFGIPHPISIPKGAVCLSGSHTGSHGGLFPEEVVVGMSVLQAIVKRFPVQVCCEGHGKANNNGQLTLNINNPNLVSLTQLMLVIPEIPELATGYLLKNSILPQSSQLITINIQSCPNRLSTEKHLTLSGILEFSFAGIEPGNAALTPESYIIIDQMFTSGFNLDDL